MSSVDKSQFSNDAPPSDEEMRKRLKPAPTEKQVLEVIRSTYTKEGDETTVEIIKELDSYDDKNYWVRIGRQEYLAKVHNGVESQVYWQARQPDAAEDAKTGCVIDLHTAIFQQFSQPEWGVTTSVTFPTLGANDEVSLHSLPVHSAADSPCRLVVRLMQWIPGNPMSSLNYLSMESLVHAGRYLGKTALGLDALTPDQVQYGKRYHAWDGKHTLDLKPFISYVQGEERQSMVRSVLDAFESQLIQTKVGDSFRSGILMGDYNDANILMSETEHGEVAGLIDFGDSVISWRVLDITVAMAYSMLSRYGKGNCSLSAAAAILCGFHSIYPLTGEERKHLRLLVAARLACSCTLGAYSYSQNPGNEYLLLHAQPAWDALTLIWKTPAIADVMYQLFNAACQDNTHANPSTLALPDPTIVDLLSPIREKSSLAQDEIESRAPLKRQKIIEQTITFVTGNKKKLEEVKRILSNGSELGFKVTNVKLDLPELQGKDPLEIAREKCALAAQHVGGAVITEDTSLCFSALGNLPGPYIKWFLETCGHNGLNNMIHFSKDKSGYAQTVVAFTTGPNEEVYLFDGQTKGTIVLPRGSLDFGWDPIFQPDEGGGLTYAEMSKDEKDSISHRSRAFSQLRDYLIQNELSINANLK